FPQWLVFWSALLNGPAAANASVTASRHLHRHCKNSQRGDEARYRSWITACAGMNGEIFARRPREGGDPVQIQLCGRRRPAGLEPFVEIGADRGHQYFDLAVKEMVGAGYNLLFNDDALLGLELLNQIGHVPMRYDGVFVAVDDQPR